jgi:hypothetical protein
MVMPTNTTVDVLIFGDELEGILAGISAAQAGAKVAICLPFGLKQADNPNWLGGLGTRGGLAYMDLTWDCMPPLFAKFLAACQVKQVCLHAPVAHAVLLDWIKASNISLIKWQRRLPVGYKATPVPQFTLIDDDGLTWQAPVAIDATADADVARQLGEPWLNGLTGMLPAENNQQVHLPQHIGVSPVFTITGVPYADLMAFEERCRQHPNMPDWLSLALPYHHPDEWQTLLTRPCYAPAHLDYLDILNPILGIAFHQWWQGDVATYPHTRVWIDGGNVARLPDGSLSFNGMVTPAPDLTTLLQWSQQPVMPPFLLQAMQAFEGFLQQVGGFSHAKIIPPAYLYVRQSVHVCTQRMATATDLLAGGATQATLGPYSYWLDTRGINLRQFTPTLGHFPKPVFHSDVAYGLCQRNAYLGVVGRSAGYGPLAQGACRIVQHNAWLGETLGRVAATAAQRHCTLSQAASEMVSINSGITGQSNLQAILPINHTIDPDVAYWLKRENAVLAVNNVNTENLLT